MLSTLIYVFEPKLLFTFTARLCKLDRADDRSSAVYSRSIFLSGLIVLRIKFSVVGNAQTFIKLLIFGINH